MTTKQAFEKAKYAHDKIASTWSLTVLRAFDKAGVPRGVADGAESHRDFFNATYWVTPANSSFKVNESFYRKLAALHSKCLAERNFVYCTILESVLPLAAQIVEASRTADNLRTVWMDSKNAKKATVAATAMVATFQSFSHPALLKVTRTDLGKCLKYEAEFADGTTHLVRKSGRVYTLAVFRPHTVNGNIRHVTLGSYVSLHSVRPTGIFCELTAIVEK